MESGIAENLRKQTRLQKLADIAFLGGAALVWPLGLLLLGVVHLLGKGFVFRRLGYILAGLLILALDVVGATVGESRWWLIAFVPHASVPIAICLFWLETVRMNLAYRFKQWYLNRRLERRRTH